jgi:hypothetical protein
MCEGKDFKTIGRLPKWYTLTKERTIVQMKEVAGINVTLLPIAEGNMLLLMLPIAQCTEKEQAKGQCIYLMRNTWSYKPRLIILICSTMQILSMCNLLDEKIKTVRKKVRMMMMRDNKRKIVVVNNNKFNAKFNYSNIVIMKVLLTTLW